MELQQKEEENSFYDEWRVRERQQVLDQQFYILVSVTYQAYPSKHILIPFALFCLAISCLFLILLMFSTFVCSCWFTVMVPFILANSPYLKCLHNVSWFRKLSSNNISSFLNGVVFLKGKRFLEQSQRKRTIFRYTVFGFWFSCRFYVKKTECLSQTKYF